MFHGMDSSLRAQTVLRVFWVGGKERASDIIIHGKEKELQLWPTLKSHNNRGVHTILRVAHSSSYTASNIYIPGSPPPTTPCPRLDRNTTPEMCAGS